MTTYLLRRLLMMVPLLFFVSIITFLLLNLLPSDPAEVALRVQNIAPTAQAILATRHELGLDHSLASRYVLWLAQLWHLNFGTSYVLHAPVWTEIKAALPATLYLAAMTLILSVSTAFALALACVGCQQRWLERCLRGVTFLFMSMPNYALGLFFLWLFAVQLHLLLPISTALDFNAVLLPALTLSVSYIGMYMRLIRSAVLSQLQQPYVFYAKARGLSKGRILCCHILPNALPTTLISIGMSIPKLLAGTVVIENIFAWPGLGRLCLNAILTRDYPMLQAYILLMAFLCLLFNFLIDLVQMCLDPRLRTY